MAKTKKTVELSELLEQLPEAVARLGKHTTTQAFYASKAAGILREVKETKISLATIVSAIKSENACGDSVLQTAINKASSLQGNPRQTKTYHAANLIILVTQFIDNLLQENRLKRSLRAMRALNDKTNQHDSTTQPDAETESVSTQATPTV